MKKYACWILFVVLSSCEFGKKESVTQIDEGIERATFVNYQLLSTKEKKGPCNGASSDEKCFSIDIQYPVISAGASKAVMDSINRQIQQDILKYAFISEPKDDFELLINEMSQEYETILKENPDYNSGWLLEISSDIIFQDSLYISTASTIFSFTGGAHPNSYQVYRSYDLATGKALSLGDFLVEGFETKLNQLAEIEFRMDKQIAPDKALNDEGYFFEDGRFQLNNNFAVLEQSLLFYYNPYEIGPYSIGPTELELKLTDYVDLIKPGSVLDGLKN
ncbi:MAG: hypothetical protein COW03_00405 [Cytophagales bacterium CG12_big_fil_rev_8_21_14_0_65_40_12]|nr:MAG: hypothetical protein COW03_00405 [Cytophagales bacterium CG12_big_fil_rev_8_21_14_0_65_40_12]PIW04564.1 MAG: hypothetical protein COW40_09185 [Cytophagales bacterium CG17_big_fil_post_rev_8_21_14_2_50_40_13]